jgi:hypothetical protein
MKISSSQCNVCCSGWNATSLVQEEDYDMVLVDP